ncbi:MAG: T9SS type A sorting domain-containing protein [Bacteroidota bacterium]
MKNPNPLEQGYGGGTRSGVRDESKGIAIFSIDGRVVYSGLIQEEKLRTTFDVSYLETGTYIIAITGKEINFRASFVKQ